MIDRQQSDLENQRANVRVHSEGVAPYIPIGHDQLNEVTQLLDACGFGYVVETNAGGTAADPLAVVNLGVGADVEGIQAALDANLSGDEDDIDHNEGPAGQPLKLRMQHQIGFGFFSTVFRHPYNGKVYKLFKVRGENDLLDLGDQEPIRRRAVFKSEVAAYEIAMTVDAIRPLIPTFHGKVVVSQVLDAKGTDISDRYLLDCCYVIDYVEGDHAKFSRAIAAQYTHLQALTAAFEAHGIHHWHDGAVFNTADSALTKVVDFALKDEYEEGATAIALAE